MQLVPTTSRQNNIIGTKTQTIVNDPPKLAPSTPPKTISEEWKHSKQLHTSTARYKDYPLPTLFDEGSQVNVISPVAIEKYKLKTTSTCYATSYYVS